MLVNLIALLFFSSSGWAQTQKVRLSISPTMFTHFEPKVEQVSGIEVFFGCYGTNLRAVSNPLSPFGKLITRMTLSVGGTPAEYTFRVPGSIATPISTPQYIVDELIALGIWLPAFEAFRTHGNSFTSASLIEFPETTVESLVCDDPLRFPSTPYIAANPAYNNRCYVYTGYASNPSGFSASGNGNVVSLRFSGQIDLPLDADGAIDQTGIRQIIESIRLEQTDVAPAGQYMAMSGPLSSAKTEIRVAKAGDQNIMQIQIRIPGQNQYCGGFFSPVMLFFDDTRPKFNGMSSFALFDDGVNTTWVEKNSPGYFLVLDKSGNNQITDREQLFGNSDKNHNGFRKLADYDVNNDGKINEKDPAYKMLKLWNDRNGDGISQLSEIQPLKNMNVIDISVREKPFLQSFGSAEARQQSTFTYRKDNKIHKGVSWDVWFSPVYQKMSRTKNKSR